MLIFGHKFIPFQALHAIDSVEAIQRTPNNSTVLFDFNDETCIEYCQKNRVAFGLYVHSNTQACLANAMGCTYIVVAPQMVKEVQALANEYLFDTKVMVKVSDVSAIETFCKNGVDGVILPGGIVE